MRLRNRFLTGLTALALLTPLAPSAFVAAAKSPAPRRGALKKMTDDLLARASAARRGAGETARVIVSAAEGRGGAATLAALGAAGARVSDELDSLGLVVADVPLDRLSELAASENVSWVSSDQTVRTTAAPDNTSHHEKIGRAHV